MPATAHPTADFTDLSAPAPWAAADPLALTPCDGLAGPATHAAVLYSAAALYVRFDCDDARLTCSPDMPDGGDLWTQDVVEIFLQPDPSQGVYFEYEISPLGRELALLVSQDAAGTFMGWQPWHCDGDRRPRRWAAQTPAGWSAACAIPFALLRGLNGVPPRPRDHWRFNLCRIDHDAGRPRLFSWAPGVTTTFHALDRFGTLAFGR